MKILVLCTGNSCRSQIADGYLKKFGGANTEVYSAGIEAHGLNPKAVETMRLDGIDISGYTSNKIEEYKNERFDFVITVCDSAKERCPVFPGATKMIYHSFPDPAKATGTPQEVAKIFASVRDEIREFCRDFSSHNLVPR